MKKPKKFYAETTIENRFGHDNYVLSVYLYGELMGKKYLGKADPVSGTIGIAELLGKMYRKILRQKLDQMPLLINDEDPITAYIAKTRLRLGV